MRIKKISWFWLVIVALLAGGGAPVLAASEMPFAGFAHDPTLPVEIAADSLEIRRADQKAILKGNVDVRQGQGRLRSEVLEVFYIEGTDPGLGQQSAIREIKARGNVFISNGKESAEGDWANYDMQAQKILMGGNVILTQGDSAISGNELHIDLEQGKGTIKGGRIKALFAPQSKSK